MMQSCTNCGAKLVSGITTCPKCGVYTGTTTLDGVPVPKRSSKALWMSIGFAVAILAAVSIWTTKPWKQFEEPPRIHSAPVRVVRDRPGGARKGEGAKISEPEAIRLLQRHLANTGGMTIDCLVVMSNGFRDSAYVLTAHNRCTGTRLGRWRVHGTTRAVTPA